MVNLQSIIVPIDLCVVDGAEMEIRELLGNIGSEESSTGFNSTRCLNKLISYKFDWIPGVYAVVITIYLENNYLL